MKNTKTRIAGAIAFAACMSSSAFGADAGAPDPAFGNAGHAIVAFDVADDLYDYPSRVLAGPGGVTYVVGQATVIDPVIGWTQALAIARFNHDGTPDMTFGTQGKVVHDDPSLPTIGVHDAAVQPDGKLVVAGILGGGNAGRMVACRFNVDGTFDASFSDHAIKGCASYGDEFISSVALGVALRADGGVLLAGDYLNQAAVVAFTSSGRRDKGFGVGGVLVLADGMLADIASYPGNRMVVGGMRMDLPEGPQSMIARFDAKTGALDATFAGDGVADLELNVAGDVGGSVDNLAIAGDASIYFSGTRWGADPSAVTKTLGKLAGSGTYQNAFSGNGVITYPCISGWNDCTSVTDIVGLPNGTATAAIYTLGGAQSGARMERFKADGSLDPAYGMGGVVPLDCGLGADNAFGATIAVQGARMLSAAGVLAKDDMDFCASRFDHGIQGQGFFVKPQAPQNGKFVPSGSVAVQHSNVAKFTLVPNPGYKLAKVVGCNGLLQGNVYTTDAVTGNCVVSAKFVKSP